MNFWRTERRDRREGRVKIRKDVEDHHTCILAMESLQLIWTHEQLEPILLRNNWKSIPKTFHNVGFREYHFYKPSSSPLYEDILVKKIALLEPIEDAPKKVIVNFVAAVNEMAGKSILCAWVHKGPKRAPTITPPTNRPFWIWNCYRRGDK